jgi:hypothetical protein
LYADIWDRINLICVLKRYQDDWNLEHEPALVAAMKELLNCPRLFEGIKSVQPITEEQSQAIEQMAAETIRNQEGLNSEAA